MYNYIILSILLCITIIILFYYYNLSNKKNKKEHFKTIKKVSFNLDLNRYY